jgi:hypothetical protein
MRIASGNGVFVTAESIAAVTLSRSTDGTNWTSFTTPNFFSSVRFVGSQFVFTGASGLVGLSADPTGAGAITSTTTDVEDLYAAAGSGSTLVAVGQQIVRSQDTGASFQTVSTSSSTRLRAVAVSDGTAGVAQFVVVGEKGRILTSNDGITFSETGFLGEPTNFSGVAYDHGLFVVTADSKDRSYTSTTGFSWTKHLATCGSLVAGGGGTFLSMDPQGRVYASTDGATWSASPLHTFTNHPIGLDFIAGLFYASGDQDDIETSPDGTTWTPHSVSGQATAAWYHVVRGGSLLGAIGNGNTGAYLARSTNGQSWTVTGAGMAFTLGYDGTQFLMETVDPTVGVELLSSSNLVSIGLLPQGVLTNVPVGGAPLAGNIANLAVTPTHYVMVGDEALILTMP